MTETRYTTHGKIRGGCGHIHRTIYAAVKCASRDMRACRVQGFGGHSDRRPVRTDGKELTDLEFKIWIDSK